MITTFEEQITRRRRPVPGTTPKPPQTVSRTRIEGTVTDVQTLTGSWQQPYPGQRFDLVAVYVVDAGEGQTARVADLHINDRAQDALMAGRTPQPITTGATVNIVADAIDARPGDYLLRTVDVA